MAARMLVPHRPHGKDVTMTRIGRNPGLRRLPLIVVVCAIGAVIIGAQMPRLFDSPLAFPVGAAAWFVGLLALVLGLSVLPYRSLSWDEHAGTATFGSSSVPLSSITRVERAVSAGAGSVSIVYRFFAADGPTVRVLVAGRPMKGLDLDDLVEFRRFVAALPIVEPTRVDGLTDEQSTVVDALSDTGGRSDVGKRLLLEELAALIDPNGTARPAEHGQPDAEGDPVAPPLPPAPGSESTPRTVLSAEEADVLERRWQRDDEDAVAFLSTQSVPAATARRVFFWITALAVLAAVVAIVIAVVLEQSNGSLDSDTNDLVGLAVISSAVVGAVAYLAWCAAADAQVRRIQALAREWLASRDPEQRTRGLAAPFLSAWTEPAPGTRLIRALSYVGATLGGLVVLVVIVVAVIEDEVLPPLGLSLAAAIGVAITAASIVGFVSTGRSRRKAREQLVLLAGWRLVPPDVEPPEH
jgi:hypothetical protein